MIRNENCTNVPGEHETGKDKQQTVREIFITSKVFCSSNENCNYITTYWNY